MPTRYVREPDVTESDAIDMLTDREEVLLMRLIVVVDDFGRLDARPALVRSKAFKMAPQRAPSTDEIEAALRHMAELGVIDHYEVDGRSYLQVRAGFFGKKGEAANAPRADTSKCPGPREGRTVEAPKRSATAEDGESSAQLPTGVNGGLHPPPSSKFVVRSSSSDSTFEDSAVRRPRRKAARFSRPQYSAEFEEWWDAYPYRKGVKAKAYALYLAWREAGDTHADLLAAARHYAARIGADGTEAKFTKNAETFLSRDAQPWRDWIAAPAAPTGATRAPGAFAETERTFGRGTTT